MSLLPGVPAARLRAPDFFCIGAEKCGTTWLWRMFRNHPDIGVPEVKELRYLTYRHLWGRRRAFERATAEFSLNRQRLWRLQTELRMALGSDRSYLRVFGAMEARKVVGDMTPQYCMLSEAGIGHMRRLAPEAKIILLMRDPVARAISGGKMRLVAEGAALSEAALLERAMQPFQLEMSRYSRMLERFEAAFPGRVFTGFMEEIVEQPRPLLRRLCRFLGVDPAAAAFSGVRRVANPGVAFRPGPTLREEVYAALREEYDLLGRRFPEQVARWQAAHAVPQAVAAGAPGAAVPAGDDRGSQEGRGATGRSERAGKGWA